MSVETTKALKLFYCYARADKALRDELDLHLTSLKRQNLITSWYDGEIVPRDAWEEEINRELKSAQLILLLITPHFIASEYCYSIEMKRALERHKAGTARVIPIILRHTFWQGTPFSTIQALPTDAKPISEWVDRDKAFWDITVGIHKTILELQAALVTPQELINKGNGLYALKRFEEALAAYDHAIRLNPTYADAYNNKGNALKAFNRFEEALIAYDHAIRLDPNNAIAYYNKGNALNTLKRFEEALIAYDHAIRLNPTYTKAYKNKGIVLTHLGRSKEAQRCYEKARELGYLP